jgi:hypothetical protein
MWGGIVQCSWAVASPEANNVCGLRGDEEDKRRGAKHTAPACTRLGRRLRHRHILFKPSLSATHVSDTQPSRVLDTPHEESHDMAMLDWDADYEREVSHPRTLRSMTA